MKFLLKIEEAINQFIEKMLEHLIALTPSFIFTWISLIKHFPKMLIDKITKTYIPKVRILALKSIGYTTHYIGIVKESLTHFIKYLRSEEFKNKDKTSLILAPFKFTKEHPFRAISYLSTFALVLFAANTIFKNTTKIISGTKALRAPASVVEVIDDKLIELKNHKFEVKLAAAAGGGHGAATAEEHELELILDIQIVAENVQEKEFLEEMEEMLDDNLEALELSVTQLPLQPENAKKIEELMVKSLNEDFKEIGHEHPIQTIKIKQVLHARPNYYRQSERMFKVEDINLQIFLEDTKGNKQVWLDFTVLATNRNVVIYLKDHDVELKDHLSTNVEPVIPQLPVEEEGRTIIKDKIREEINQFLEKNKVEGKIQEIYIDYLMVS